MIDDVCVVSCQLQVAPSQLKRIVQGDVIPTGAYFIKIELRLQAFGDLTITVTSDKVAEEIRVTEGYR